MVSFPTYEKYKSSGVEWLGDIPEHWQVKRLKNAIESSVNGIWGSDPSDDKKATICIRVADFTRHDFRVSLDKLTLRKISESDFKSRQIKKGDLLLEKSGGGDKQLVGQVVIYEHDMPAICSNFLARLRIKENFNNRFLTYAFSCLYFLRINYKHIKQTTGIQNIDSSSYFSELFSFPPVSEQTKIAEFLDRKTEEIDNAISKKKRLIELLQEQKTIIINQAVTKGLNPNVPMKDSGIEWLGDIPEHWEVKKLKFTLKNTDYGLSESALSEGEFKYLNMSHIRDSKVIVNNTGFLKYAPNNLLLETNDILFNRTNSFELVGKSGIFKGNRKDKVTFASYLVRLRVKENSIADWLNFLLNESSFLQFARTLALRSLHQANLNPNRFGAIKIPVPPLKEQEQIVYFLTQKTVEINQLKAKIEQQIEQLKELKQILIANAVTGKIKI